MNISEVLRRYDAAEFAWGKLDCCLFVADVLRELHGVDYAAPWRGTYSTEYGAKRLIVRHGGLSGLACAALGVMHPACEARDSDPVLLSGKYVAPDSIGAALGICEGREVVYLTERGLARAPLSAADGCWHVGGQNV